MFINILHLAAYEIITSGSCPHNPITSYDECAEAVVKLGIKTSAKVEDGSSSDPKGCYMEYGKGTMCVLKVCGR